MSLVGRNGWRVIHHADTLYTTITPAVVWDEWATVWGGQGSGRYRAMVAGMSMPEALAKALHLIGVAREADEADPIV